MKREVRVSTKEGLPKIIFLVSPEVKWQYGELLALARDLDITRGEK